MKIKEMNWLWYEDYELDMLILLLIRAKWP